MKILAALTYYYPHWTGLTAYAKRIAEGLVARGHEVTVLTTRHSEDLAEEEVHNGVRIVRVNPVARLSRGVISPDFPAVANRLIRESDLVQIHTPLFESLLVALLCRHHDVPLLFTHHGDLVMPEGGFNQVVERLMVAQMTASLALASRISIHSQDYAENSDFLWPYAPKLACIYPPAEIPRPQPEVVAQWRAELGLTDKKLVGFAGRFVEEKGFDYLLRAIPHVIQQMPEAHFVYAGEHQVVYEDFYGQCKDLIDQHRDHLTFVGLIRDQQKLANFYALTDAFALPSRTDCFPSVQIESLLCGTPLVTANIPGAREVVRLTGMGRLVEARNPQALAEGLVDVLRDPTGYSKRREEIRAFFNTQRTLDEYEALMCTMVGLPAPVAHAQPAPFHLYAEPTPAVKVVRYPTKPRANRRLEAALTQPAALRAAKRLHEWLDLPANGCILLGSSTGAVPASLEQHARVITLDLVDRWNEGAATANLTSSAEYLPFADGTFDALVLTDVLGRVPDDRATLRELHRILKPGGQLLLAEPHRHFPWWWDPINHFWTLIGGEPLRSGPAGGAWYAQRRLYRPHELLQRTAAAGFMIETSEEITHYALPGAPYLLRRFGSLLKPLSQLIDRLNDLAINDRALVDGQTSFVSVLLNAHKP